MSGGDCFAEPVTESRDACSIDFTEVVRFSVRCKHWRLRLICIEIHGE